jgi:hypothetical protein
MDLKKPVSGRQFAKMVGQSEGAVRKAVSRQSIVAGITADKKFIPITASNEWGKAILPEFLNDRETSAKKTIVPKPKAVAKKTVLVKKPAINKKQTSEALTFDEVIAEVMSEKLPAMSADELDNIDDKDPEEAQDHIEKPEAERQAAIIKVKILRLSYMEKRGQMVPITKVNTILFGYGQEIRTAIEGMPNRILDKILGCKTRHEAKKVFEKEIYETLNLLADIQQRKFE